MSNNPVITPEEAINRLEEIKEEIRDLAHEALQTLRNGGFSINAAKAYWFPHIVMALDDNHSYLGGSMRTIQDEIKAIQEHYVDS